MATEIKTRCVGSEGGHWYNESGLVLSVPSADGKRQVKPTIAHARKFELVPSVTGILKLIDKPNLTNWLCKEFVRATTYVEPKGPEESFESYFGRVAEQKERFNDHAVVGTDIHAQIAKWAGNIFNGESNEVDPIVNLVCRWLADFYGEMTDRLGDVEIEIEKPFANRELGYGGTVDWKFVSEKEVVFADFKTTDDEKLLLGSKLAYRDSHLAQLVAYDLGTNINITVPRRRYINIFIGRLGGGIYVHEWTDAKDIDWARSYFRACLKLFKIVKGL